MDILLAVNKTDFYQQAVTAAVPPPYLVTGHQIRSLPPTYTAKKRKRKKKKSGKWGRKPSKKANLQLKLEELYVNFNVFSFLCNILLKPLNQAGMTWKEWD